MKAKRRQELKTNDLAAWLDDVRHSASKWGGYLAVGVIVVVGAVVISAYMRKARNEARIEAYEDLQKAASLQVAKMDKTEEELRASLSRIDELVAGNPDASFRINALFDKASMATALAQRGIGSVAATDAAKVTPEQAKQYLADARAAYEQVVRDYSDHTLYLGRALYGLFQVESLSFVLDGDAAHRAKAAEYLEKLRDDPKFNATPLQSVAIERLKSLDAMFTHVTFPKRPEATPAPVMAPPVQTGERISIPLGPADGPAASPAPAAEAAPEATPAGEAAAPEAGTPEPAEDAAPAEGAADTQDAAPGNE